MSGVIDAGGFTETCETVFSVVAVEDLDGKIICLFDGENEAHRYAEERGRVTGRLYFVRRKPVFSYVLQGS